MGALSSFLRYVWRLPLAGVIFLIPAWWAAARLQKGGNSPFFRLLVALGLALLGYISSVNLLGRLTGNSIAAVSVYLLLNAIAGTELLRRRPRDEFRPILLLSNWRSWAGPVLIALALSLPQWLVAVSSNYWDESNTSAIHLTAPNQFAEGIFPPRHNALPDVTIKYHYAFTMLSGTMKWLLGVSANAAIDLVSTGLWLYIFLFIYFWLRRLEFDGLSAMWGAFAALLGGGLAWLYLPRIEAYTGIEKIPPVTDMRHHYDVAINWLANLKLAAMVPSQHLRNADGSLSNLPEDIAAQFQQHAGCLGIAMTLVSLYLFATWRARDDLRRPLLALNIVAFGTLFLGHAVFGVVAAITAGSCLFLEWFKKPTRQKFSEGLIFTAGVSALAFLHGGMLTRGAQYGGESYASMRRVLGYSAGGLAGFVHWNVAGFGLPLLLAIAALCLHSRRRDPKAVERNALFTALAIFGVFSYLVPQIIFYSSETYGDERYTEISKFFFSAHLALALLSAFGVAYVRRLRRWWVIAPFCIAAAISPVIYCYANSVNAKGAWLGFYHTPYHPNSIEEQMATALRRLKKTNHDVYFDASGDERRSGYLNEMFVFGGSVFSLTPSAYERTGIGYRLSAKVVARRFVQNSRMARLLPGAAEAADVSWYYSRPLGDMALLPVIVRSRFKKLVTEGTFVLKFAAGLRALYAIEKPTTDLDSGIERYWATTVVAQTAADCDGDGRGDLIFYDDSAKKIICGRTKIDLPEQARGEIVNLFVGRFPGNKGSSFHIGRMKDTDFRLGKDIEHIVEKNDWAWTYRDSVGGKWQPEYDRWFWNLDIPLIADLNRSGFATFLAYRVSTGQWLAAPYGQTVTGPKVDKTLLPMPFAGRFLEGSRGDLGLWSLLDGMVTIKTIATGKTASFRWGGTYGFILVPGDYDGDGRDEIGVYNQAEGAWYWKHAPDGPLSYAKFGTKTAIPVPWDYNHDGRLDLAYWEPGEGKIYVSFSSGRKVDLVVPVPPHSIPAFVNMY